MKINEELTSQLEELKNKAERDEDLSNQELTVLLLASLLEEEGDQ